MSLWQNLYSFLSQKCIAKEKSLKYLFSSTQINSKMMGYIIYSIHDSDISDFYRYIIGGKLTVRTLTQKISISDKPDDVEL